MRKFIAVLALLVGIVTPVYAEPTPTVAMIDTGFNTALFPNNIAYEVCIVSVALCPNGKQYQEGTGAATVASTAPTTFAHGTQVLSVLTTVNPDAKVIVIRVLGMNTNGRVGAYTIDDINKALGWVVDNKDRFNIKVVSISQGKVNAPCRVTPDFVSKVATLKSSNVVVLASTGNESNRKNIAVPACIDDVVSVGATDNPDSGTKGIAWDSNATPTIALYSNGDATTDFYTNARFYYTAMDGSKKFGVGTSNATAALAGWWLKNLKPTVQETYDALVSSSSMASNAWLKGRYILIK